MPPVPDHQLANQPSTFAWAERGWRDFPGPAKPDAGTLIILPVHGLDDHGLGLSLDVEEVVASELLRRAAGLAGGTIPLRLLPPFRHGLSPYPSTFGGLDPDDAATYLSEIATAVADAGFGRLVFWVSNPWSVELIDAVSRDIRANSGLQTFVVEQAGLNLSLHPTSPDRVAVQAIASHLLAHAPEPVAATSGPTDVDFRPGNHAEPFAVEHDASIDAAALLTKASKHLARLLTEIAARAPLGFSNHSTPATLPARAPAAGPSTVWNTGARRRYLPALSRTALQQLPAKESAMVVIAVGAIEQHGPHLPVGVDAIIGQAAMAAVARALPTEAPVWFAPPIVIGKSNEHQGFPGTVSISARSLRRLVRTAVKTWHAQGFRQFALLNTHGGNSAVLVYTIRELQTELGVRLGMVKVPMSPELSAQEATWGFHAGEWETALMLAIAPSLVRMERAVCHYPARLGDAGELRPENAPAIFSWITKDIAPDGVMGDATAATAEKGRRWWRESTQALTDDLLGLL